MNNTALQGLSEIEPWLADFPVPCFTLNTDRVVTARNALAEKIALGELGGRPTDEIILEQWDSVASGRRSAWSHDHEFIISAGGELDLRYYLPQYAKLGAQWMVLFSDVSGLYEASHSTARAFSLLGHEVKTPITSIRMTLHLLAEEKLGALTPEQREIIQASRDDCENMLNLVQQISEIFLIESKREDLVRTFTEPSKLIAAILAENHHLFEKNSQRVVIYTPTEELPRLYIDTAKVIRAAGQLLKTAATHGKPGENISISISLRDKWLRLAVSYKASREVLVEERRSSQDPFGLGGRKSLQGGDLGLAICKALITSQGGRTGTEITERYQELYLEFPLPNEKSSVLPSRL